MLIKPPADHATNPPKTAPEETKGLSRRTPSNARLVTSLAVGLAVLVLILGLRLLLPFFEPITWAIILALFFFPVYNWIKRRLRLPDAVISVIMCLLIIMFIIIPVFGLLGSLTAEIIRVYNELQLNLATGEFTIVPDRERFPVLHGAVSRMLDLLQTHEAGVKEGISDIAKRMGEFFLMQGTVLFKNVAGIIFNGALMLLTLYFLFIDGEKMLETFKGLLPMPRRDVENFAGVTADVLSATLYGNMLNAAIQGGLGIFIMWVLDFSAPLLWGMLIGLSTFIPIIGPALIWLPATVYLFVSGIYLKGAILLTFSILVISQIDYFLRPIFISGKTQLHTLFLFFSILGGINVFGLLGLVLGPILMALCVSILELYKLETLGLEPHDW
ncbi:MAG TPA: AI-2E family transporter [Thermodesulfobacteriaceae bacterium]|nr:AI-2E family transporter [Thermodesulfobacteriaceae bacterium]